MKSKLFALLLSASTLGGTGTAGDDYQKKNLANADFSGKSLVEANFTDATLTGAKFGKAKLKGAIFRDADLKDAQFYGADLTGADMRGTKLTFGLENTILAKSNWEGSTLGGADKSSFREANLRNVKFERSFQGCDFGGADLRGASLRGAYFKLPKNEWKDALYDEDTAFPDLFDPKAAGMILDKPENRKPAGADYHDKTLTNGDFSGKSLNRANFSGATLTWAKFGDASLKDANYRDADIKAASFAGADMTGADMRGTKNITGFDKTNLAKANWEGGYLGSATATNFQGANLRKTKMEGRYSKCDFRGADLSGANLRAAPIIVNAGSENKWKGAIYDGDTAFSDEFDPKEQGMVLSKPDDKK